MLSEEMNFSVVVYQLFCFCISFVFCFSFSLCTYSLAYFISQNLAIASSVCLIYKAIVYSLQRTHSSNWFACYGLVSSLLKN